MTKEQLIQIAIAGFPTRVLKILKLDELKMHRMDTVYRLYHKDIDFVFVLPKYSILTVCIDENNFIQINTDMAFNHYSAIKEIERLGIIHNVNVSLPTKDEAVNKGYRIANVEGYNYRRVCKEPDHDIYYSGWMDCFDWINSNDS